MNASKFDKIMNDLLTFIYSDSFMLRENQYKNTYNNIMTIIE